MKNSQNTACCTPDTDATANTNVDCCSPNAENQNKISNNKYAKSNPNYLQSMFGATDLTPLWLADMDFKVAEPITAEIQRLANRSNYAYEFNSGEVFSAIANWNKRRNGLDLNPKSFVQVPGVLTGIALLIRELTKESDNILIQTPVYHQFFKVISSAKRNIIDTPLKIVDGRYEMDWEDLTNKLVSNDVKLMILCNPHNPVGRVWTKEEIQRLSDLANEHNVTIISDEIHSDVVFAPARFNSIASVTDNRHIAVLGSPAKTFGMQSISQGYLYIADQAMYEQIKATVGSMYLDHGNVISNYATLAAYNRSEDWLNNLIDYLQDTIKWIEKFLRTELPQVKMYTPEGTYQTWLDFSGLGLTKDQLNDVVVKKAKLALTPGDWFGAGHEHFMRMNLASPKKQVQDAFIKLSKAVNESL